ncbi:hypothetical protein BJX99DRAFT_18368 [Aspergillus californicus]
MSLHLNGVALVTGAGSGIGRECALGYAAEGAKAVVFADLSYERAVDAAQESETVATNPIFKAMAVRVDPADLGSVADMISATMRALGRIDYFVNSTWIGLSGTEADAPEPEDVQLAKTKGTLHCIRDVVQIMKNQAVGKYKARGKVREVGRGSIVTIGAPGSFATSETAPETSEEYVLSLTKKAALDLAAHGIRLNAVCPGWVENGSVNNGQSDPEAIKNMIPMTRMAKAEEIADVVLFLSSPRASYVTGGTWTVDGGVSLQSQDPVEQE